MLRRPSTIASGASLALLAALCFGATTPAVARAGRGLGAFTTAALLYAGAYCLAQALTWAGLLVSPRLAPSAGLPHRHWGRLVTVAVLGAGVAPTSLAWGLQRAGATAGSLLLNLEAVFTVSLAWAIHREHIGRRVLAALVLMALGGVCLTWDAATRENWSLLGALAIIAATFAWALDNTLSRSLAEQDVIAVVRSKSALGALLTAAAAIVVGERQPNTSAVLVLLFCGATGYGLSLRLYLLAQRRIGAARTGSIFAVAPFIGAALSWTLGDRALGAWSFFAASLFGWGVLLHATERHQHWHSHEAIEHDHVHRHDDGHHAHTHEPAVIGEHSHPHRHVAIEHEHDHAPDLHHDHRHD